MIQTSIAIKFDWSVGFKPLPYMMEYSIKQMLDSEQANQSNLIPTDQLQSTLFETRKLLKLISNTSKI
jgi:hypothetical protein